MEICKCMFRGSKMIRPFTNFMQSYQDLGFLDLLGFFQGMKRLEALVQLLPGEHLYLQGATNWRVSF